MDQITDALDNNWAASYGEEQRNLFNKRLVSATLKRGMPSVFAREYPKLLEEIKKEIVLAVSAFNANCPDIRWHFEVNILDDSPGFKSETIHVKQCRNENSYANIRIDLISYRVEVESVVYIGSDQLGSDRSFYCSNTIDGNIKVECERDWKGSSAMHIAIEALDVLFRNSYPAEIKIEDEIKDLP